MLKQNISSNYPIQMPQNVKSQGIPVQQYQIGQQVPNNYRVPYQQGIPQNMQSLVSNSHVSYNQQIPFNQISTYQPQQRVIADSNINTKKSSFPVINDKPQIIINQGDLNTMK